MTDCDIRLPALTKGSGVLRSSLSQPSPGTYFTINKKTQKQESRAALTLSPPLPSRAVSFGVFAFSAIFHFAVSHSRTYSRLTSERLFSFFRRAKYVQSHSDRSLKTYRGNVVLVFWAVWEKGEASSDVASSNQLIALSFEMLNELDN